MHDFSNKNLNDLLQIDQQNVKRSMEPFLNNVNSIPDVHAP